VIFFSIFEFRRCLPSGDAFDKLRAVLSFLNVLRSWAGSCSSVSWSR